VRDRYVKRRAFSRIFINSQHRLLLWTQVVSFTLRVVRTAFLS